MPDAYYRFPVRTNPVLDQLGEYPIAEVQAIARRMRDGGERLIDFSIGDPANRPRIHPAGTPGRGPSGVAVPDCGGSEGAAGCPLRGMSTAGPVSWWIPTRRSSRCREPRKPSSPRRSPSSIAMPATPVCSPRPGTRFTNGNPFCGRRGNRVQLSGDFVLRAADVPAAAWDRLRLLWTCSPHNPTGAIASFDDVRGLYEACREHDTLLLSDEPYIDMYEDEVPHSALEVAGPGSPGSCRTSPARSVPG